jgi:SAM-dependent methyltransferase
MTLRRILDKGRRIAAGGGDGRRSASAPSVPATSAEELRERLAPLGTWMYRFDLGHGVFTALHDEYLDGIHRTRGGMMFPQLDELFAGRWDSVRCLDAACNEGHFAFEIAKRGAKEVVGFDARDGNIRKADFVRTQLGVRNASFRVDNVFAVSPERYGTFELTLCLGLMYHLEDPMGALRRLRSVTTELCVIDTEVARSGSHATIERGPKDGLVDTGDVIAVVAEPEWTWNPLSSVTGISLIPSLSALRTMLAHAGFTNVTQAAPVEGANERYANGDRVILFARV